MLKSLIEYPNLVSLTPNSGIQFLDFAFNINDASSARRTFWPERIDGALRPAKPGDQVILHPVIEDDIGSYNTIGPKGGASVPEAETFNISALRAIAAFDGAWLPAPIFRRQDGSGFELGPTTWARLRIIAVDEPHRDTTHRVTIAFDTQLTPRAANAEYAAPQAPSDDPNDRLEGDANETALFSLTSDEYSMSNFLTINWIEDWISRTYCAGLSRQRNNRTVTPEDFGYPGEHWAAYWVFIEGIAAAVKPPSVRFIDVFTRYGSGPNAEMAVRPVDVSLIVDIGNSRTAGVFVEENSERSSASLTDVARLELRNLSKPECASPDPFQSRVEFSSAWFGEARKINEAGRLLRRRSHVWPSPVRIGDEAVALAALSSGVDGSTGMSSPKRYLWDEEERPRPWRNHARFDDPSGDPPAILGPVVSELTSDGRRVDPTRGSLAMPGLKPVYSRSALYKLLLVELISHAVCQVNSADYRRRFANADAPRKLKRIVLTLPTATPVIEQAIMKAHAEDALALVWTAMGWSPEDPLYAVPEIILDWDEATVSHLVYIYNEVDKRFRRQPHDVFDVLGRGRRGETDRPAVRVASIDIGGGTTDLMVIEHEAVGESVIAPRQLFREGFRIAGDDMLKTIIEVVLLPAVIRSLADAGLKQAVELTRSLFSGDIESINQAERAKRGRCVAQALTPAAVGLLQMYEALGSFDAKTPITTTIAELAQHIGRDIGDAGRYLDEAARNHGAAGFKMAETSISITPAALRDQIQDVLGPVLGDLCDVVRSYACDVVLLTGRPSRLPAIKEFVMGAAPVPPDRVISMSDYQVGAWYPFRGSTGRIEDPKSTAVVGAMLAHITYKGVQNFRFRADKIKMRSTARYFGLMQKSGEILNKSVFIENDTDIMADFHFEMNLETDAFLGFRQLPLERWPASPLYYVYFKTMDRLTPPVRLHLERKRGKEDDVTLLEHLRLDDATDADNLGVKPKIGIRLQTFYVDRDLEAGYWLDSGVLNTNTLR